MKLYMNKLTGDLCLMHPQWEPIKIDFDEKFYLDLAPEMKSMVGDRKIVHGVLVQVGWMLQNHNGVWFGLPLSVIDQFDEIGDV